jgi:hypothetical protein
LGGGGFTGGGGGDDINCFDCDPYVPPPEDPPTVSIDNARNFVFVGSDPTVVATNLFLSSGTPSGGTYSWSASTTSWGFSGSSTVRVTAPGTTFSSSLNDKYIRVRYAANGQYAYATRWVTARLFKFLTKVSQINIGSSAAYGYHHVVTYNVFTHPAAQQVTTGASDIETLENMEVIYSNISTNPNFGAGVLNDAGQVLDHLALESNAPIPANARIDMSQDLFVGGFFVRNNTVSFGATTVTVTSNGPLN